MGTGLLSPGHLVIVFVIVLLVFGAKRLPELGRSLGSGMREFKETVSGEREDERVTDAPATAGAISPAAPGHDAHESTAGGIAAAKTPELK